MNRLAAMPSYAERCDLGLAVRSLFDIVEFKEEVIARYPVNCPLEETLDDEQAPIIGRTADGQVWQAVCTDEVTDLWWITPLDSNALKPNWLALGAPAIGR